MTEEQIRDFIHRQVEINDLLIKRLEVAEVAFQAIIRNVNPDQAVAIGMEIIKKTIGDKKNGL